MGSMPSVCVFRGLSGVQGVLRFAERLEQVVRRLDAFWGCK